MLEQKWTKRDRDGNVSQIEREGDAWIRSLDQRWAAVKFEKDEVAEEGKGVFDVPQKSVNEILQELRVRGSGTEEKKGATTANGNYGFITLTERDPNVLAGGVEASPPKQVLRAEVFRGLRRSKRLDQHVRCDRE